MGEVIQITASDGHTLDAYRATPAGSPRGGVVILQEIFGVTGHIRRVADGYAEHGFIAMAPSLFDRIRAGIVLEYSDVDEGRAAMMQLDLDDVVTDVRAAVDTARSAGRVAAIGYCWGGAIADLAACRIDIDAAVSYYGRMIVEWIDEQPRCPVMYHFGGQDPLIPPEAVERIGAGRKGHPLHVYEEAGHGFNCDERAEFVPDSAALALERTLTFLAGHLDGAGAKPVS